MMIHTICERLVGSYRLLSGVCIDCAINQHKSAMATLFCLNSYRDWPME